MGSFANKRLKVLSINHKLIDTDSVIQVKDKLIGFISLNNENLEKLF